VQYAHEIMDREFVTVEPGLEVGELAKLLLDKNVDGACVMEGGELVGVVTAMDLVYQEKQIHLPSFITLMEMVIPFGSARAQAELEKVTGSTVADIMSAAAVTVAWDAPLDEVATLMVDRHFTIVPVMKGDNLQGVVTKRDLLRAAYASRTAD
jgi:CBS domain-containing protein